MAESLSSYKKERGQVTYECMENRRLGSENTFTVSIEACTGVSVYPMFMLHVSCKSQERRVSGHVASHKESISPHVLTRSGCRCAAYSLVSYDEHFMTRNGVFKNFFSLMSKVKENTRSCSSIRQAQTLNDASYRYVRV